MLCDLFYQYQDIMSSTKTVAMPAVGDVTLTMTLVDKNEIPDDVGVGTGGDDGEAGVVIVNGTVALHNVGPLYN
jgi:hypothetical protein